MRRDPLRNDRRRTHVRARAVNAATRCGRYVVDVRLVNRNPTCVICQRRRP